MKKGLSKAFYSFLCVVLLGVTALSFPTPVKGETLGSLKEKLAKKESEYKNNKTQRELTDKEIEKVKTEIGSISAQIEDNRNTIVKLDEEIIKLNEEIIKKEQEIKDVVKFYQISSGTSTYLEYIFGASDFTDLIYRMAISEQLVDYNNKLVDQYNKMVDDSKKKQEELRNQEKELQDRQQELETKLSSLGKKLSEFVKLGMDIEEEIKAQKEAIKLYEEQYKCKDDEEISVCTTKQLPADTSFWRPLKVGVRTDEYGYRTYKLNGRWVSDFHTGIDISVYDNGSVPVYASAAGVVIYIVKKSSCGGNQIYLHHNINGKTYTTVYMHLRQTLVEVGDVVTKDTQIAIMGGNPSKEYWDKCSTGSHLHFAVSTGLYFKDYSSWSSYVAHTINPRSIVNFPSGGTTFYDRTTKY